MLIDDVKIAYRAVARGALSDADAAGLAAKIDKGELTLDAYIADLTKQAASTTSAAVAIASFITGVTPTADKLDALKIEADKQVASYTKMGVGNPALGAFEAFGKGFAEDPSTGFATKYGAMSGDDFIKSVYASVYGGAPSEAAFSNLAAQIAYFTKLYVEAGLPNAALMAKGAALGQIVGYAFTDPVAAEKSTLDDQVNKLLVSAAKGDASVFGKALPPAAPPTPPNNGGPFIDPPRMFDLTDLEDKFTGGSGDDVFTAPLGSSWTLNDGDALDGGSGLDTLNIHFDSHAHINGAFPSLATVRNIEIVNLISEYYDGSVYWPSNQLVHPHFYQGVKEIWQINGAAWLTNWRSDVVAGFRGSAPVSPWITAANDAASISIGIDVPSFFGFTVQGAGLDTLIIKKAKNPTELTPSTSIVADLWLNSSLKHLTVKTDVAAVIRYEPSNPHGNPNLDVFDASESTAGVIFQQFSGSLHTIKGGAGSDNFYFYSYTSVDNPSTPGVDETITAMMNAGAGDDIVFLGTSGPGKAVIDMGAGNDTVKYFPGTALTIDLGDGDDMFEMRTVGSHNLRNGDVIKGGAGFDTYEQILNLWSQPVVTFDGIEKFIFKSGVIVDATGWTGVKEFVTQGGATFSGMTSDVAIHVLGDDVVTANFADKANPNNSATFVTYQTAWGIIAPEIENITIDMQYGWAHHLNQPLIAAQLKTLTLKGAGDFTAITPTAFRFFPDLTTIDARDLAGTLSISSTGHVASSDLTVIAPSTGDTYIEIKGVGGALTFVGGSGRDYVYGYAGADTISMGDGGGYFWSRGGADKITLGGGSFQLRGLEESRIGAMAEVTGFTTSDGADRDYVDHLVRPVNFAGPSAPGEAAVAALTGSPTLAQATTAFFSAAGSGDWTSWFVFKGDTYVVRNLQNDGFQANDDMIVRLIGVTDFSADNVLLT